MYKKLLKSIISVLLIQYIKNFVNILISSELYFVKIVSFTFNLLSLTNSWKIEVNLYIAKLFSLYLFNKYVKFKSTSLLSWIFSEI